MYISFDKMPLCRSSNFYFLDTIWIVLFYIIYEPNSENLLTGSSITDSIPHKVETKSCSLPLPYSKSITETLLYLTSSNGPIITTFLYISFRFRIVLAKYS